MDQQEKRSEMAATWLSQTEALLRATLEQQLERCPEMMNWADRNGARDKITDLVGDLHSVIYSADYEDRRLHA